MEWGCVVSPRIAPNGTPVTLPDGTHALAYPDHRQPGRYTTIQATATGTREDRGWRREQLTVAAGWGAR